MSALPLSATVWLHQAASPCAGILMLRMENGPRCVHMQAEEAVAGTCHGGISRRAHRQHRSVRRGIQALRTNDRPASQLQGGLKNAPPLTPHHSPALQPSCQTPPYPAHLPRRHSDATSLRGSPSLHCSADSASNHKPSDPPPRIIPPLRPLMALGTATPATAMHARPTVVARPQPRAPVPRVSRASDAQRPGWSGVASRVAAASAVGRSGAASFYPAQPQPQAPTYGRSDDTSALIARLGVAAAGTARGRIGSNEARAEVVTAVLELERIGREKGVDVAKLNGTWELVYSSVEAFRWSYWG
eukprot:364905-Chlamydomonas_euryale.AAC.26